MFHSCNEATHVNMILHVKQEQHDAANKVISPNKPLWQGECTTKDSSYVYHAFLYTEWREAKWKLIGWTP